MRLQFDPNQGFQLEAISAVTDLFDGQPIGDPEFSVIKVVRGNGLFKGQEQTELGIGNRLLIDDKNLLENVRLVQQRNRIPSDDRATLAGWNLYDEIASRTRLCPHFSVEMETGTGKTYVYLRTIFELAKQYGFKKFIIVVPSVPIREGVLKNLEITQEHFRALYNNMPFDYFVYDAKKLGRLRTYATANTVEVAIINIDAFRKNFMGTEAEQKSNVIYKESDKLSGRQPIEFIRATRPIVIIDEPQSVDNTEKSQEAIRALNPLCTLRYSATHLHPYNLVYSLDPIRAFEMRLVKQIVVASAVPDGDTSHAYVKAEAFSYKPKLTARLRINVQTVDGPKPRTVTVRDTSDLFDLSKHRSEYENGYKVKSIYAEPGAEIIEFANRKTLRLGEEMGGMRKDVWRAQIRHTIRKHLDKELQVTDRAIKVLSLFFIDRVANYRIYDEEGHARPGLLAQMFEEELDDAAKDKRYQGLEWLKLPRASVHNAYFAADKKGVLKDTKGDTQADDDVYNLIMKEKERLLSLDEPLRFIFSHSALREGWDNPNVFQICTLNESHSAMKKRQEIGRGLRLPVDASGLRVHDDSINKLYVMANESYEEFAKSLQREYEDDGIVFGKVPLTALAAIVRVVEDEEREIGTADGEAIYQALIVQGMLTADGRIAPAFDPDAKDFTLGLPEEYADLEASIIDVLTSYQLKKHIRRERDEGVNRLKKEVLLGPEFAALWERIKPKTHYRVEFETDELVTRILIALKRLPRMSPPKVLVTDTMLDVSKAGIGSTVIGVGIEQTDMSRFPLPDVIAYLQDETDLTRSTIVRILRESGSLYDFFINPQQFMDEVAKIMKYELRRLLVDGIKYERIEGVGSASEWEMLLFKDPELIDLLTAAKVNNSVYEYVPYDSEVERRFAKTIDARQDVKLFVKLPAWFKIDTPIGTYNPDWAIVRHRDDTVYMVRETKNTKNFLKLRTAEADKVNCGARHFEAINVPFGVSVTGDDF